MKVEKFSQNNFPFLLETLLLSDEEFLVLMKQKYGTSNRLNLITEIHSDASLVLTHVSLKITREEHFQLIKLNFCTEC